MKKIIYGLTVILAVLCLFVLGSCDEHEHNGEAWGGDVTHHWYVCDTCNSPFGMAEHDYEEAMNDNLEVVKTCKTCGYSYVAENIPEHEHTYSESLSYNDAFHYKTCTYDGCLIQSEKAEHSFGTPEIVQETGKITKTYPCEICEYKKLETITVDTVIKDDTSWNLAFENLELKNYQMTVSFKENGTPAFKNECVITDDGAYVSYDDGARIIYTKKNADGAYDLYRKEGSEPWVHTVDAEGEFYFSFVREATLQITYEENYNKFTYNSETGEYTCAENIECIAYHLDGTQYSNKMFCFNNVVKVADGKISHIECDYYFEGNENTSRTQSFIYYNIGMAEFEIPESVKSSAVNGENLNGNIE